ncbi:hypothetical protein FRC05_007696 [Tulasnella sp. 425]|nr:hypothetical protein FRC05_007696 [Tulasnella sp. 425]
MDASQNPPGHPQASSSVKGKQVEDKSMLIRSLSTILHHTSSSTGYARVVQTNESEVLDEEDQAMKRFLGGLALIFDSGESGDATAVSVQIVSQGILLDVAKSSNKHASVPQHFTLKLVPPESELKAQLEADWPTFFLKWTRFALTPSLHTHFIHSLVTHIHSPPLRTEGAGRRPDMAQNLRLYTYFFCKEKIRQRLAAIIPTSRKGNLSSASDLRFRRLFYDDTTLEMDESGEVDFDGRIPADTLFEALRLYQPLHEQEMPWHLRRQDETWLANTIGELLPNHTVEMFNRQVILDEGIADVVSHFLVGTLVEIQYYIDELETMLATQDLSKNPETNRKALLRCLTELLRPFNTLTSMAEATEAGPEIILSGFDSVESLVEESDDNVDYGYPGQPIHEMVWTWLESLTEWTYTLHQICHGSSSVGYHLRRGLTIRLWIPELIHPIKQASLEDTLAFVNWHPEEQRSLETLQKAALAHWHKRISGPTTLDDPRYRILLGLEDRSRWSNAFQGFIHPEALLACLMKEKIIRSRMMATSRRRCSCCTLLIQVLDPDIVHISTASSGSRSLPWALPPDNDISGEIESAVVKALCTRLKQVLWAATSEERRRAVEASSKVVAAKFITLRRSGEDMKPDE